MAGVGLGTVSRVLNGVPNVNPGMREKVEGALSSDGKRGRIVELIEAGQPLVLLTHWQSVFGNGHGVGLDALVEVIGRLNEVYGERIEWVRPSEIAKSALTENATKD